MFTLEEARAMVDTLELAVRKIRRLERAAGRERDATVDRHLAELGALWGKYVAGRPAGSIDLAGYTAARRSLLDVHDRELRPAGRRAP
jgi:hypothetical protein